MSDPEDHPGVDGDGGSAHLMIELPFYMEVRHEHQVLLVEV